MIHCGQNNDEPDMTQKKRKCCYKFCCCTYLASLFFILVLISKWLEKEIKKVAHLIIFKHIVCMQHSWILSIQLVFPYPLFIDEQSRIKYIKRGSK